MAHLPSHRYISEVRKGERTRRLIGEGVELRRHQRRNYPLYARWYGDEEVWRLSSWTSAPMQRSAVESLFQSREASNIDDSFAIHRAGEERPLGVVSLMNISEANASAELSVILGDAEDRKRGLGSEAIRVILRYGFEELGLHRVGLSVFEFNGAAISAYEKLGFREEGRLRQALHREGKFHDAILMSVLAPEWREEDDPNRR